MTQLTYTRHGVRFAEIWFNIQTDLSAFNSLKADIIIFKESYTSPGNLLKPFRNGVIPFRKSLPEIQAAFDKGFAYETRRAEKEGIICSFLVDITPEKLSAIFSIYTRFCTSKQIAAMPYRYFQWYLDARALRITVATQNDTVLQYHLYFASEEEMILLASFPAENIEHIKKSVVGYANRALHWFAIQQTYSDGKTAYNLGGIGNSNNSDTSGIVKFKMEMAPDTVVYYYGTVAKTFAGRLYLRAIKLLKR